MECANGSQRVPYFSADDLALFLGLSPGQIYRATEELGLEVRGKLARRNVRFNAHDARAIILTVHLLYHRT
jgi:hypothetical protein